MSFSQLKTDINSSIDFDFFESEGNQIKMYGNEKQGSHSKIITKAVIETNPLALFEFSANSLHQRNPQEKNMGRKEEQTLTEKHQNIDCSSSPTSSCEKSFLDDCSFDDSLLNCLAFNYRKQDSVSSFLDEKDCSDNSLSDSTITTVTSDFTSVSPLNSSDSSCTSDDCVPSLTTQNEDESAGSINFQTANELVLCKSEVSSPARSNYSDKTEFADENSNVICSSENDHGSDKSPSLSNSLSGKESNILELEEELGDISLISQSSSKSSSLKVPLFRGSSKFRLRKKDFNLTFNREELIKIERDNLILLKKIMAHSKPRTVSLNQSFGNKKTSAAINRAKQQKKIEHDNYILYNKISAMGRTKKVF